MRTRYAALQRSKLLRSQSAAASSTVGSQSQTSQAADPHALAAGGGYRGGGGRNQRPGRFGRAQSQGLGQGWGNFQQYYPPPHHFQQQSRPHQSHCQQWQPQLGQQQQYVHQHPTRPPVQASQRQEFQRQYHQQRRQQVHNTAPKCGLGGPYDSGSNACGWYHEDFPPPPNAPIFRGPWRSEKIVLRFILFGECLDCTEPPIEGSREE